MFIFTIYCVVILFCVYECLEYLGHVKAESQSLQSLLCCYALFASHTIMLQLFYFYFFHKLIFHLHHYTILYFNLNLRLISLLYYCRYPYNCYYPNLSL